MRKQTLENLLTKLKVMNYIANMTKDEYGIYIRLENYDRSSVADYNAVAELRELLDGLAEDYAQDWTTDIYYFGTEGYRVELVEF